MKLSEVLRIRAMIEKAASSLSDEDAIEAPELFPAWEAGVSYAAGARVSDDDKLYRCVQAHTSQAGWEPGATPALWVEVSKPGEIPVWKQPAGAHDSYMRGDQVHYPAENDPVYESTVDNNVWPPDVYGWIQVSP